MHECPMCGEVCYCDCDDTFGLSVPDDCPHVCDDDYDDVYEPDDGYECHTDWSAEG